MSKVFRHHTIAASNVIQGWGVSTVYNSAIIENMQDPAGASASSEITSVPSPFARMALVKSAFAWVNANGIDGQTIHHKMVSHCLDIGQIFFNYDNYQTSGIIKLVKWDKTNVLGLMASEVRGIQLLGRTLDLFLTQDADTYNFRDLQSIYLLQYTGEGHPSQMTIIGATSPSTLFVTPANDMDYVGGSIRWGSHAALQSDAHTFQPLYKRDPEFVVWLYAMRKSIPNFAVNYKEVNAYLDKSFVQLPQALKNRISALLPTAYTTAYLQLDLMPGVPVEIAGVPLRKKQRMKISDSSDFTLAPTKPMEANADMPLVLPNGLFTQRWKYVSDVWDQSIRVEEDPRSLSARTLPGDGTRWPYLSIHDFLEPTIVEMDTDVLSADFFDGNLTDHTSSQEGTGYLLPVKRTYFDYFTPDDLKQHLSLAVEDIAGGGKFVKATLRIPLRNNKVITFEKNYMPYSSINDGSGLIDHRNFTLALFPCTRFTNGGQADYRITYMSKGQNWEPAITCYDERAHGIAPLMQGDRNKDMNGNLLDPTVPAMPVYAFNQSFDFIELSDNKLSGIAVPMWKGGAGGAAFQFAVDFGTTNTHIEYRIGGTSGAKALDMATEQLAVLNADAYQDFDYKIPLFNAVIPHSLGAGKEVHFPLRTVLSFKKNTNWQQPSSPYVTGNMPFYYGILGRGSNNEIEYDLKWSNAAGHSERISCYLASLMLLMRNKVAMEGGALANTSITWFYPTSMPANMVTLIEGIWEALYVHYFGGNTALLRSIPESIAPYKYYQQRFGAGIDVLTIDIGGGTSDATIVDHNGQVAFITSFRFAANSLFGDAFTTGGTATNGFVNCFRPQIEQILQANGLNNVQDILKEVAANQPSADLISFFFTLKENSDVKNAQVDRQLDFLKMMSLNAGAKTLMLVFYASIIYHLAQFIKAKEEKGEPVGAPAYLAFSGNGSKLLQVLGAGSAAGTALLGDYTIAIFEKVTGKEYPHQGIQFVTDYHSPKEATSRGGLDTVAIPNRSQLNQMVQTFLGTTPDHFVGNTELYNELSDKDWNALETSIQTFTDVFYDLAREKDIEQNFGTLSLADLRRYRHVFTANTKTRTRSALNYLGLLNTEMRIENTLFFYPVTNILHDLAQTIL